MASGDEQVVLLGSKISTFTTRIRIALAEKHIEYEFREVDLANKSQLLLQMNPVHEKIPVLIHNGKPVCESLVILEYIDEAWPTKISLLPPEPYRRSQARFWAGFADKIYTTGRGISSNAKGKEQDAAKNELIWILKTLEGQLGDEPYFGGADFGLVDVCLVPFYSCFHVYEACGDFKIEPSCPKLVVWGERCMMRESVAKSVIDPNEALEIVMEFRKKLGVE